MKPAPFVYHRPASTEEALAVLAQHGGEAKPLAGGQSLIPAMNFRLARPAALVDLDPLAELAYVREADGGLAIGAMTRQRELERSVLVARRAPLLAEVMPHVAHPQIRNRGTVGGSLAHADPAAELPAALLALEACYRARSTRGERWIAAENFSTGLFATALEPDELLVEVVVPAAPGRAGFGFAEMARRHGDYALAGVAVRVTLDEGGRLAGARIVLLSVGDGPVRAREAETALTGQPPSAELLHAAAEAAAQRDTDPPSDIHASAAFRRRLVETLTRRTLTTALERARVASA